MENKKQVKMVDQLSGCSLKIDVEANSNSLGSATGFIVKHNGIYFMITNWHVVSGRNADTNEPIHSSLAVPDNPPGNVVLVSNNSVFIHCSN